MQENDQVGLEVARQRQKLSIGDTASGARRSEDRARARHIAIAEELHEVAIARKSIRELALDVIIYHPRSPFIGVADDNYAHCSRPLVSGRSAEGLCTPAKDGRHTS
ncbi:MAG: hypothetical protein ACLPGW_20360 [Roseiarcus sp.]